VALGSEPQKLGCKGACTQSWNTEIKIKNNIKLNKIKIIKNNKTINK